MRMLILCLFLLIINVSCHGNPGQDAIQPVDTLTYSQKHQIPFDTVVAHVRKLIEGSEKLIGTIKEGMKSEGVVGYMRKHEDVFAPIVAFVLLYAVWLRRAKL